jgi:hypothetical protein
MSEQRWKSPANAESDVRELLTLIMSTMKTDISYISATVTLAIGE